MGEYTHNSISFTFNVTLQLSEQNKRALKQKKGEKDWRVEGKDNGNNNGSERK